MHSPPQPDDVPPTIWRLLEPFAAKRIHPDTLIQWYQCIYSQQRGSLDVPGVGSGRSLEPPLQVNGPEDSSLPQQKQDIQFGCPWCGIYVKLPKDFIRHVKQKCYTTQVFRCPDCPKKYARKERFAKHHQSAHRDACGGYRCCHVREATVQLPHQQSLQCGFCGDLYRSNLHGFLRHLIDHYRQGATLDVWARGPHVPPLARPVSPPSHRLSPLDPLLHHDRPRSNGYPFVASPDGLHEIGSPDPSVAPAADFSEPTQGLRIPQRNSSYQHLPQGSRPAFTATTAAAFAPFRTQSPEEEVMELTHYNKPRTSAAPLVPDLQSVHGHDMGDYHYPHRHYPSLSRPLVRHNDEQQQWRTDSPVVTDAAAQSAAATPDLQYPHGFGATTRWMTPPFSPTPAAHSDPRRSAGSISKYAMHIPS